MHGRKNGQKKGKKNGQKNGESLPVMAMGGAGAEEHQQGEAAQGRWGARSASSGRRRPDTGKTLGWEVPVESPWWERCWAGS